MVKNGISLVKPNHLQPRDQEQLYKIRDCSKPVERLSGSCVAHCFAQVRSIIHVPDRFARCD